MWHGPVQAGQRESPADARRRRAAYARLQKISWTIGRESGLSTHDIEDIHQEALERTTKYIYRGGNRPANHEAFFTTVVKNLCVDRARRSNREAPLEEVFLERMQATDAPSRTTPMVVRSVLSAMPEDDRTLLVRNHIDGYKPAELARQLGSTPAAVSAKLYRARKQFRREFISCHLTDATDPECAKARSLIVSIQAEGKGRAASKELRDHERSCPECAEQHAIARTARVSIEGFLLSGGLLGAATAKSSGWLQSLLGKGTAAKAGTLAPKAAMAGASVAACSLIVAGMATATSPTNSPPTPVATVTNPEVITGDQESGAGDAPSEGADGQQAEAAGVAALDVDAAVISTDLAQEAGEMVEQAPQPGSEATGADRAALPAPRTGQTDGQTPPAPESAQAEAVEDGPGTGAEDLGNGQAPTPEEDNEDTEPGPGEDQDDPGEPGAPAPGDQGDDGTEPGEGNAPDPEEGNEDIEPGEGEGDGDGEPEEGQAPDPGEGDPGEDEDQGEETEPEPGDGQSPDPEDGQAPGPSLSGPEGVWATEEGARFSITVRAGRQHLVGAVVAMGVDSGHSLAPVSGQPCAYSAPLTGSAMVCVLPPMHPGQEYTLEFEVEWNGTGDDATGQARLAALGGGDDVTRSWQIGSPNPEG